MKKLKIFFVFILFSLLATAQEPELLQFLKNQPSIISVEEIPGNSFFEKTFKIMVRQQLDHTDKTRGFFNQRVFIADKGKSEAVLFITEGYAANYAQRPNYLNELSPILNSNQICVEHRYFGQSWPDSTNWDFLTVENVAADHHKIVEIFKEYYSGKWINTGISKGGQTAIYHLTYYPKDVDATVAYVCPLNFGVEDGRHEPFIKNIPGTKEQRKKIKAFQIEILKNRETILPKLEEFSKQKNYTFRISPDEVLDYCVLEYPFALWQWGRLTDEIPGENAGLDELFKHLMIVSGPSYFAIEGMEGIKSFFIQAARELGYYGYNTKPFKKYLSIKSSKKYLEKIFLPESEQIEYIKRTAKKVKRFIQSTDKNILFVYGEFDPWSASGFEVPQKTNFLKIVKPEGSHSTRINNLPENQQFIVQQKLEEWLEIPVVIN